MQRRYLRPQYLLFAHDAFFGFQDAGKGLVHPFFSADGIFLRLRPGPSLAQFGRAGALPVVASHQQPKPGSGAGIF